MLDLIPYVMISTRDIVLHANPASMRAIKTCVECKRITVKGPINVQADEISDFFNVSVICGGQMIALSDRLLGLFAKSALKNLWLGDVVMNGSVVIGMKSFNPSVNFLIRGSAKDKSIPKWKPSVYFCKTCNSVLHRNRNVPLAIDSLHANKHLGITDRKSQPKIAVSSADLLIRQDCYLEGRIELTANEKVSIVPFSDKHMDGLRMPWDDRKKHKPEKSP